ncbi:unnamed protein product [Cunninghamella blakesleeana]
MSPTSMMNHDDHNRDNSNNNNIKINMKEEEEDSKHVNKKLKTSNIQIKEKKNPDVFKKGLFDPVTQQCLREQVTTSQPYPHCKIDELVNDELLRKVKKEIMTHLQFTAKETDIYKVNQTGDLANMDGLSIKEKERLNHLFQLREAIYSQSFRDFISEVTQCGPLSAIKMDMSVNIYNQGCHLLNHDDVIGDRCVSFILYMPDDDDNNNDDNKKGWQLKDGGALELYGVTKEGMPANEPDVSILPQWNSFAFFKVVPGYSFHAVQEVASVHKSRLSIQGWFHYPQKDEVDYDPNQLKKLMTSKSSLEHLLEDVREEFHSFEKLYDDPDALQLNEQDHQQLSTWMNPNYLNKDNLETLSDQFIEQSSLQLIDLLEPTFYHDIRQAIYQADKEDDYFIGQLPKHGSGIRGSWYVQGSPISQRYLTLPPSDLYHPHEEKTSDSFYQLLNHFQSTSFRKWLTCLTKLILKKYKTAMARRFRPGLDYTLATLPIQSQQPSILDVTFSLLSSTESSASSLWEQGDVGGYLCYMENDDHDDASIYRSSDQDGALLMIPCKSNELSIVLRDEGVMKFIKYVSAHAFGSRWDLSLEYETC